MINFKVSYNLIRTIYLPVIIESFRIEEHVNIKLKGRYWPFLDKGQQQKWLNLNGCCSRGAAEPDCEIQDETVAFGQEQNSKEVKIESLVHNPCSVLFISQSNKTLVSSNMDSALWPPILS